MGMTRHIVSSTRKVSGSSPTRQNHTSKQSEGALVYARERGSVVAVLSPPVVRKQPTGGGLRPAVLLAPTGIPGPCDAAKECLTNGATQPPLF